MRRRYTEHLSALTNGAPQLLIALEYEQQGRDGPPFSVDAAEVQALYGGREPTLLAAQAIPGGLKGEIPATEKVWLLRGDKAVRSHLSI
jgi:thiopurine S-methyltransferase